MNKTIVIYHGNCADGYSAAWVVRQAFIRDALLKIGMPHDPKLMYDKNADEFGIVASMDKSEIMPIFHAGSYSEKEPPDVVRADVILVDFSYKRDTIQRMCDLANSVLIIDHHKTAIEDLAGFEHPKFKSYFDLEHSGAMLAWFYYFNDALPPPMLAHVEDRDLGKFNIFGTREANSAIFSYPYTWANWDMLMLNPPDQFIRDGAAIDRKHLKDCKELIEVVTRRLYMPIVDADGEMRFHGLEIPVANVPYMHGSDVANILAQKELDEGRPPVAGYYYDTPKGRNYGFRSIGDFDCSRFAKALGGGGHRNASGANNITARQYEGFEVPDADGFIPHDGN